MKVDNKIYGKLSLHAKSSYDNIKSSASAQYRFAYESLNPRISTIF